MKISFKKLPMLFFTTFTFLLILFVSIYSLQARLVTAQSGSVNSQDGSERYFATTTNAKCEDFYNFNGVEVDIKPNIIQSIAGTDMTFFGYVLNNNKYPVVEGKLYVKIFRDRAINDSNGPDVLDAFVVKEGINLNVGEKLPIDFKWKIPANSLGGKYKLATYFITSGKFNLAGLSFTDDVVGSLSSFSVKGQLKVGVSFKKDEIKINNKNYFVATYPPVESATEPVTVLVPIINTTKERQAVETEINVYKWDSQSVENKIDSMTQMVIIEAGKTITIPVVVKDSASSVYYIESFLKYKDSKSVLGIRFVRDGVVMPRINFPSITSYPLVEGKENKIFACFHNASNSNVPVDGKLRLEILSADDNSTIMSYEYNGKIIGEMGAVVQNFTPNETYKNFKIHASLFSGEKLVDEVYIPYNCNLIDPKKCGGFDLKEITSNKWLLLVFGISGILVLLLVVIWLRKKKVLPLGIGGKGLKTFIFMIIFVSTFSTYLNTYAAIAPASGSGSSCFSVSSVSPTSTTTCNLWGRGVAEANKCGVNNKVRMNVVGTGLLGVNYINVATYPVTIISKTSTTMLIEFERLSGEWTQGINFSDTQFFPVCKVQKTISFTCLRPTISSVSPNNVLTNASEPITITGSNLNNVQSIKLQNMTIDQSKFTSRTDTSIVFMSPRATKGWKDLYLNSVCMKAEFDNKFFVLNDAIEYIKPGEDDVPVVPPPYIPWSVTDGYNEGQSTVTNSDLYYWATTSATTTGDLSGGSWATALSSANASINYDSSITYEDGVAVQDGDDIPVGTILNFNFDQNSTTSSSNIYWTGTGYTQDTPYGKWLSGADYPSQVCTTDNKITTQSYTSPITGVTKNIDVFIPLSVHPPTNEISFVNTSVSPIFGKTTTFPTWGAPPYPVNDSASWSCNSPSGSVCSPTVVGSKRVYMYYSPTYGYYYYGWRYTTSPNTCYTNDVPLNEKVSMKVNNSATATTENSTASCAIGSTNCIRSFINNSNIVVGCPSSPVLYPYYNKDTNKCYTSIPYFLSSFHVDNNIAGQDVSADYYYPYQLKFRESVYKLDLNITSSTTVRTRTPAPPTVTGQETVVVNTPADYQAYSTLILAKEKSNSMLGSLIIAVKKLFAAEISDLVEYQIDWDGDGVVDQSSSPSEIKYGDSFPFSHTWSSVGSVTFKVRAMDVQSRNLSAWVDFTVDVVPSQPTTLDTPVLSGTYCGTDLSLSWSRVANADGYTINRGTSIFPPDITGGDIVTKTYTGYIPGLSFNMYAYKLATTSTSVSTSTIPPTTWTQRDSVRYWDFIASSDNGSNLVAVVHPGYIYTSTDSGATWTARMTDLNRNWRSVASDGSGTKLVAVVKGGYIYTSTDSGQTWTQRDSVRYWQSVASDSTGQYLVAVTSDAGAGRVYVSSNYGASWSSPGLSYSATWWSIASDSTGAKLVAVAQGGYVYTSINYGVNWTQRASAGVRNWVRVDSDSTGAKLVAAVVYGYIYTSSDAGVSWATSTTAGLRAWVSVNSSSDGSRLAATVGSASTADNGNIYTSTDGGSQWTVQSASPVISWRTITSSADGSKLAAISDNGYIYTSQYESTTTVSTITTDTITSSSSNSITPVESCASSTVITTASIDGVKFFANPPWARSSDNKCQFFGSASSTITITSGGSTQTLLNTTTSNCKVDNAGSIFDLGSSISPIGYFNVGKHILSCSVSYNKEVSSSTVYTSTFSGVEAKCSQVPKVIEK